MEWVIGWLTLAGVAGMIGASKKRSFFGYFLIGLVLPIIGIVAAIMAKPNEAAEEQAELQRGDRVRCPHCAEIIRAEASVCRFCGRDVIHAGGQSVGGVVLREDWNQSPE
jgi:hypothetical protein